MKVRKFREEDIRKVAFLKNQVFSQFNKKEYFEKEAVNRYMEYTNLNKSNEELLKAFHGKEGNTTIFLVAEENKKIIGFIKGRKNKIANLFVLGKYHKKGFGKKLIEAFEKQAKKSSSKEIRIKASLYATPFYQKMGYKKTTGIRNFMGLKIQPMKKKF